MEALEVAVVKISRLLDKAAGFFLASVMALVVVNIPLRLMKVSILGTYEYVGYLTAAAIGLAVAYCAVQKGHIAVGILVEKLAPRKQQLVDLLFNLPVCAFLGLATYHLARYAGRIAASGEVSPTTELPFYPFIYLVALGFLLLCLVSLAELVKSLLAVIRK